MPAKYHIHVEPAPPRVRPVGKLGIVDWREDCSSCHNCVKRSCVYGFYSDLATYGADGCKGTHTVEYKVVIEYVDDWDPFEEAYMWQSDVTISEGTL